MSEKIQYSSSVREMPTEDRPRERLARVGPEALRDAELLAILFRTGTREEGAVALAERLVRHFGNLRKLARASLTEIMEVRGIGPVKAIEMKAALELGKRLATNHLPERFRINTAADVAELLMVHFKEYETEHFKCLLLNAKGDVLKTVDVSHGSLNETLASPRDVFRQAVREGATSIVVAHNHPSGDPEPSGTDMLLTDRLKKAGELLQVPLLDHVVFGDGRWVSMKERELM